MQEVFYKYMKIMEIRNQNQTPKNAMPAILQKHKMY